MFQCGWLSSETRKNRVQPDDAAVVDAVLLGLPSSGKTLLLKRLLHTASPRHFPPPKRNADTSTYATLPTIGIDVKRADKIRGNRSSLAVREIGGAMLPLWREFVSDANCLIFVVNHPMKTEEEDKMEGGEEREKEEERGEEEEGGEGKDKNGDEPSSTSLPRSMQKPTVPTVAEALRAVLRDDRLAQKPLLLLFNDQRRHNHDENENDSSPSSSHVDLDKALHRLHVTRLLPSSSPSSLSSTPIPVESSRRVENRRRRRHGKKKTKTRGGGGCGPSHHASNSSSSPAPDIFAIQPNTEANRGSGGSKMIRPLFAMCGSVDHVNMSRRLLDWLSQYKASSDVSSFPSC